MTIVTKPLASEKKPIDQIQPLVDAVYIEAEPDTGLPAHIGANNYQNYHTRARGIRLFFIAVLIMLIAYFGGLAVYRLLARSTMHRGYCRVPYQSGRYYMRNQELVSPVFNIPVNSGESDEMEDDRIIPQYFQENYEIDLDEDAYAELEVPEFGKGREGRFIHEFSFNQSAIVDIRAKRCFIMPLDRERIMAPKNLWDVVLKMQQGVYNLNTTVIRETMHVNPDPLDEEDMSEVGPYIRQKCAGNDIYKLERQTDRIVKRDTLGYISAEKPYIEFGGKDILQYDIVNLHELDGSRAP